jgi:hypothetical protein
MSARIIPWHRRETAAAEAARLDLILAALKELGPAREGWDAIDQATLDADLGEAEWEALERLQELEAEFLKLALDPEFAALLECLRDRLADIAEGRP